MSAVLGLFLLSSLFFYLRGPRDIQSRCVLGPLFLVQVSFWLSSAIGAGCKKCHNETPPSLSSFVGCLLPHRPSRVSFQICGVFSFISNSAVHWLLVSATLSYSKSPPFVSSSLGEASFDFLAAFQSQSINAFFWHLIANFQSRSSFLFLGAS